jgi:hypothetical protein
VTRLGMALVAMVLAAVCGATSHVLFGFGSSWAEAAAIWIGLSVLVVLAALWDRVELPNRFELPRGVVSPRRFKPPPGPSADPVAVHLAFDEVEAELLCAMLRSDGIRAAHRQTNLSAGGFGEGDVSMGGPREVIVPAKDFARARELLEAEPVEHGGRRRS